MTETPESWTGETTLQARCSRKDLSDGVQTAARAVSGHHPLPMLKNLMVSSEGTDSLRLLGSDLDFSISLSIPASISSAGALSVPAKLFAELLGSLNDESIQLRNDRSHSTHVIAGHGSYRLVGLPPEDYPPLPELGDAVEVSVPQGALRSMIRQTAFAASGDETRPILTGVLMDVTADTVTLVATDTHRLAVRRLPVEQATGAAKAIIPARAMNELLRVLTDGPEPVQIYVSASQALFRLPSGLGVQTRLIEGQYPNYQRVVPQESGRQVMLCTQPLLAAAKRAAIIARTNADRMVLTTGEGVVTIVAEAQDEGKTQEDVEATCQGESLQIAFNAKFIAEALGVIDAEGIYLDLTDSLKPAVLRPVQPDAGPNDTYLCVLMPMQLT